MKCQKCGKMCERFRDFDLRLLNQFGDVESVEVFSGEPAPQDAAHDFIEKDVVALVLEKHVGWNCRKHGKADDVYIRIWSVGSKVALEEGGWTKTPGEYVELEGVGQ